jgi:hypothetical protein
MTTFPVCRWFELSEIKLFNTAGVNIASQAKVELLVQPKNPQDIKHITDNKLWKLDKGSAFVVWTAAMHFHGAALVRLSFPTPQKVIGAELYSTNYESFGYVCPPSSLSKLLAKTTKTLFLRS